MTSSSTSPEHVEGFDAATAPKGMARHLAPLLGYPGVIWGNRTLLGNFFRRDLLGRFRGSFLGILWVLIQPLFLFAIYFFVFGFLFAPQRSGSLEANVPFALYLFTGIIAFTSFSEATTRSCNIVLENGNLVKKVRFPCELLPVPPVLVSLIVYLVGAALVLLVGHSTGALVWSSDQLALPVVLVVHVMYSVGFGLLLSCLQVMLRDTTHLYNILQMAWFFLSPIFWPMWLMDKILGEWAVLVQWNPTYPLIQAHRQALGYGVQHEQMRDFGPTGPFPGDTPPPGIGEPLAGVWVHTGAAALWGMFFLALGYSFFMSRKRKFSDLV